MKFETFFDNFELLTDAPNATVKLREIILQLAVQGKLVPQFPNDEPAKALIERIQKEKKSLVKQKKIPKTRESNIEIDFDNVPYKIPENWLWVSLAEIGHDWGQKKPDIEFTYIDVSAINKEQGIISNELNVVHPNEAPSRARKIVTKGTVIYSTVRPYLLNIAIIDRDFEPEPIVSTAFAIIHPFEGISNKYIYYYLRSKSFIEYVESQMLGMAYPAINDSNLFKGLIPLPPTTEQKRIVEKCDRLLSICDEIEKRQQQKQESIVRMNESAIAQLLSSQNPDDFRQHWQRICNNFDLLYSVPETIPKLRQAILQLAVQGKLVSQDPNDEPASVLLEKIKLERKRLLEETTFREPKDFKPIHNNEILFELPKEWMWSRIGELFLISSGTTPNRLNHKYFEDGTEYWVKTTDLNNETVLTCEEKITKQAVLDCNLKYYPVGTVCVALYGGAGTIGKSGLLGIETTINQSVCGIYPNKYVNAKYLHLYIKLIRPLWMNFAASLRKAPNINAGVVNNMVFPLPPLAEQKRIVEKCDRLMSLCDTLEAKLKQGRESSEKLMEVAARQVLAN